MQTHLEPLAEEAPGRRPPAAAVATERDVVARIVRERDRRGPGGSALRATPTTGSSSTSRFGSAAARRSPTRMRGRAEIEETIRRERPEIADVIVHTEPLP